MKYLVAIALILGFSASIGFAQVREGVMLNETTGKQETMVIYNQYVTIVPGESVYIHNTGTTKTIVNTRGEALGIVVIDELVEKIVGTDDLLDIIGVDDLIESGRIIGVDDLLDF
ncbi:MAG: hypothetical protein JKY33_03790 [Bacteroidia bacterium]|nr:hypothetical protein [Bacteroidia bacterium]